MNYKLLYQMECEENLRLTKRLKKASESRDKFFSQMLDLKNSNKELIQLVEELKAQSVIQNVPQKDKLVERIIIETYA